MILKKKLYRWTSLSEGLKYIDGNPPKKMSFWINNKREAEGYAIVNKVNDKLLHWSIVQWEININQENLINITPEQYKKIQNNDVSIIHPGMIGKYKVGNFEIYILPKDQNAINYTIIKIV